MFVSSPKYALLHQISIKLDPQQLHLVTRLFFKCSLLSVCTWRILQVPDGWLKTFRFLLLNFYHLTQASAKGFVLIQTKEVSMRPEDVKRVFQNSAEDLVEWITKGTVLFFCGLFIFSCSGVLLRLIDFIWQSCFQLVSSRLIHIYSIESVNLCFRYYNRAGKQAQWILKCHFVIQQLYIMLWIMIVPLLHWKLKQLMFLLVSILHLNYFSKHQSSVFFRSKKVIWSSCWHEFGYYNIADCKFSSIDLVFISEINWKSQDPHFSWKQFHNRSVY